MRRLIAVGGLIFGLGALSPGFAQQSTPEQSAGSDLAEIIVTAQRRSENVEKVPVAVTVVSPEQLTDYNLKAIEDIQLITPGLIFNTGLDYPQNYIRGVGTQFSNPGLEPPVATYIDGAYQSRAIGTAYSLFDVANVQVLKGPQGTLYGRNATGGAILINSADPTNDLSLHTAVEGGNFDHLLGEFTLNVPVSDTLAVRLGAREQNDGGYITNLYDGDHLFGSKNIDIVRGKARWSPSEDFSAILTLEYSRTRDYPLSNKTPPGPCTPLPACSTYEVSGFYDVNNNEVQPFESINKLSNLRLHYDVGQFTLDSTTAYTFGSTVVYGDDQDHSPLDLYDYYADIGNKTFTEDVQAGTKFSGWFNFLTGLSYVHDKGFDNIVVSGEFFQPLQAAFGAYPANTNYVRTTSYSGFAEAYLTPIDRLKITLGARYTHDSRNLDAATNLAANIGFTAPGTPMEFSQGASFHDITPRVVIAYDAGDVNLYASFNRGFKAGGYVIPAFAPTNAVQPETIDSYEIGAKFVSPDRRLRLNAAVFHYNYRDVQVSVNDAATATEEVTNAGAAHANGVELDANAQVTNWLSVLAGLAYLDAKYTSFPNGVITLANLGAGTQDLAGYPLDRAPTWTSFIGGNVVVPITRSWRSRMDVLARYTSTYDFNPGVGGPLNYDYQPAMTLVNMTGGVGPNDGKYEIGFFVNNLTNKEYYIYRAASSYGLLDNAAAPRTYGIRISATF